MSITFHSTVPILRIFDIPKAEKFYTDYLGFQTDWDHRFDDAAPLYRQISRSGLVLHLSEHHGDGSPGVHVRVGMTGLVAYHAELQAKAYRYLRPGIEEGYTIAITMGPSRQVGQSTSVVLNSPFASDAQLYCTMIRRPEQCITIFRANHNQRTKLSMLQEV
ncbi:hypothetical protein SNOG_09219 [Parastagonospora nodorum SN15]|uniref:VOC domain-containing protein n=1 Tax=Phaeosphaeria nodorum (strain SN15 / ATCC MYA-4574 / FGSC 10173) TaxID=321614 RepID=Q0UG95_PHANO|nr:hypothetical protein SNOG_09219 [Parastagonospora nodorum SN15]EAT83411.1 hypothetical protein SNOG_09219 [Parastagonospora nodorum SN15]